MYRAIRPCFHRGHLYKTGDSYTPTAEEIKSQTVPRHFVKDREFSDDLVISAAKEDMMARKVSVKAKKAD